MGNKQCKLVLRLDDKTFTAGGLVTGRVYLAVTQEVQADGLFLLLQGEECCQIAHDEHDYSHSSSRNHSSTHREIDRASSSLVHMNVALTNFSCSKVVPGQYEYPFEWQLPSNLPSTMYASKGDSHCEIRYRMTAYLHQNGSFGNPKHSATQAICLLARPKAPSHSTGIVMDPEVIRIKSCCFDTGQVTMGWDVDKTVASPDSFLKIGISGRNESSVEIDCLRARLIETITWAANGRREEKTTTLTESQVPTTNLPQWHSSKHLHHSSPYEVVDMGSYRQSIVETQLLLPKEARDSYNGSVIQVRHSLVITAKTPPCHTTVESGSLIRVQRQSAEEMVHATSLPAYDSMAEPTFVEADILPPDWRPQEAHLIKLPASSAVLVDTEYIPPNVSAPDESLLVEHTNGLTTSSVSAPDESLLSDIQARTTASLSELLDSLARTDDPVDLVSHELNNPMMVATIQNLTPREFVQALQAANRDVPSLARLLAGAMDDSFQCRHVLACVWTLPPHIRMDVLTATAPLASDLDTQREIVERELDDQEIIYFRAALK
jgi:hypothetical protein